MTARSRPRVVAAALVEELRAGDDRLDQDAETMAAGGEPLPHRRDRGIVRRDQAAPEGVRQQLAAEVVDELGLAPLGEIAAQAVEAVSRTPVGECGAGLDRAAAEVAF